MARPYRVEILVASSNDAGVSQSFRRVWTLPEGVELTQAKLAPAAQFILDAVAELDTPSLAPYAENEVA